MQTIVLIRLHMERETGDRLGTLVEIPDAEQDPSVFLGIIDQLPVNQVLALWHGISAHDYMASEEPEYGTEEAVPYWDNETAAAENVYLSLKNALLQLPQRNLDHARDVYTVLAGSPLDRDRREAGFIIRGVVRFDREFGLSLWDQLLRDPVREVRSEAKNSLNALLESSQYANDRLAYVGISWEDAYWLLNAYHEAESGFNVRDVGHITLREVLQMKQAPGQPS
jgi:hypothetical protein